MSEHTSGVRAMIENPQAATCGLTEFLMAYNADSKLWWRIDCGHHENLFDAAVERIEELEAQYEETP